MSKQAEPSPCDSSGSKVTTASGSKARGRPKKALFSPAASKKLGGALDIGHSVVVRWTDGLFYHGLVLRVDEANDRCQVQFEEGSTFYVLFKDIHKVPGQGETSCCVCKGETSEAPNRIVLCDNCELGYHQSCHNPPVVDSVVQSQGKFFCRLCTYAFSVILGSSHPLPSSVSAKEDIKPVLPYKMNLLTWDAQRRVNVEQRYCYCGGPGDWYCKMLQCCRCRQWFHEACVQCLQHGLLYGDRFFMFVCWHCNQGQEYVRRLPFKWVDVAHLALFNLTLTFMHKYYDLDEAIMPWVVRHADSLSIQHLLEGKPVTSQAVRSKVEAALNSHRSKFTSGREVKKKHTLWALVLRIPPNAPSLTIPLSGPINADVLSNPSIKGRKMKHILPTLCQAAIPLKYPSRAGINHRLSLMFKGASASKVPPEPNNNGLTNRMNGGDDHQHLLNSPSSNDVNGFHTPSTDSDTEEEPVLPRRKQKWNHEAEALNAQVLSKRTGKTETCGKASAPTLNGDSPPSSPVEVSGLDGVVGSGPAKPLSKPQSFTAGCGLDHLVPVPRNFQGANHPFRTEIEKELEKRRLKHFETRVAFLTKEYAEELAAFRLAKENEDSNPNKSSPVRPTPTTPEQKRRGVKRKLNTSTTVADKDPSPEESIRRSKRSRNCAERYQHIPYSFPRYMSRPEPSESLAQRWKWLSVVDQLRYGEKFQIQARRKQPDGTVDFLLHWVNDKPLLPGNDM